VARFELLKSSCREERAFLLWSTAEDRCCLDQVDPDLIAVHSVGGDRLRLGELDVEDECILLLDGKIPCKLGLLWRLWLNGGDELDLNCA
jgi:hypothetical protein